MGFYMADKKHRNSIRIATTTQERESEAISVLLSRELLYNRNNKTLGIVLEDEEGNKYRQIISGLVDEVNITKNENYETKLKEDIIIDSVTTQADHKGVDWKSQYKIAETTPERTVILLCKQDTDSKTDMGVIGGEVLEVGAGVFGHYQISLTSTGSHLIKGATTFDKKARIVLAKYNGTYYYGIKFKSAAPANIYFAGWSKIPDGLSAPLYTTYNDGDLSEGIELDDDSDTGTKVIDFLFHNNVTWEFTGDQGSYKNGHSNPDWDWGNGLTNTDANIVSYWYPKNGILNNNGFLQFQNSSYGNGSGGSLKLKVIDGCTVKVGFVSASSSARYCAILDEDFNILAEASNGNSYIKEVSYTYEGDSKKTFLIGNRGGAVRFLYVKLEYTSSNEIFDIIDKLPDTGEDGSPHIIRLSGEITKDVILKIATSLDDPTKQIVLDLSKCTMESQYVDWTEDTELHGAFSNCVSLREFYYPMNVTSSGGNTFKNCSFLRKVIFNNEMKRIGGNDSVWSWENNAMFAGARIKTLFIPKSVNKFGGYPFSYSNIVNLFIEEGSTLLTPINTAFGQWNTWVAVKESLRLRVPQSIYNVAKNTNTTFKEYGANGDGINTISKSCKISDHIALWDGDYESIDYTAKYDL